MTAKKGISDLIRVEDAVGWLDAMANVPPGGLNQQGAEMMKDMDASAADALRKGADGRGLILRSEAMAQINNALPNPPEGIHPRNADAWSSIRCTFREAMWYPGRVEA